MKIFAIGDLHLGFAIDKPMDIFGDNWTRHYDKIRDNWISKISDEDVVLIPGDISWAMSLAQAEPDLEWIRSLPGRKIIGKGNHDYWWSSLTKMKAMYADIDFLYNNFHSVGDLAIVGTRGWVCPNQEEFTQQDERVYQREATRLRLSIDQAIAAGFEKFIVMLHYPPTNEKYEDNLFTQIIEEISPEKVVYGHLHSYYAYEYEQKRENNDKNGKYGLVSADYVDFDPVLVIER